MPAVLVDARKLMPADDLAPPDAVHIGKHDVEGLDVAICIEKALRFVDCGA